MSAPSALDHRRPPRTDAVRAPGRIGLRALRRPARVLANRRWPLTVHGAEHVPASGPVLLACNHTGWLDGPLLVAVSPRPVHALSKQEAFSGAMAILLRGTGQIRLDRFHTDVGAMRSSVRVLRDGGVVGIFPEGTRGAGDFRRLHRGTAYLALVSGAPVVPVVMFGVREPGARSSDLPPRGHGITVVYDRPLRYQPEPWPRTRARVDDVTRDLGSELRAAVGRAQERTGLTLPGPLPAGDKEHAVAQAVEERKRHD